MDARSLRRLRDVVAALLLGQGLLVLLGILDHETPRATAAALVLGGLGLLALPRLARRRGRPLLLLTPAPARFDRRALAVAVLGLAASGGVLLYNLVARSDLAAPEVALVVYGVALLFAAPNLATRVVGVPVGALFAYSVPLVLAPLGLWALNALLAAGAGGTPLALYIRHGLVAPMALALGALGLDVQTLGETVRVGTPRGALFLTVGVVCAGLYAGVVFLGVFGLFAWEARTTLPRLALYLAIGLAGLHLANVLRLVLLGVVGWAWGASALQDVHRHAGWALFLAWSVLFWALVLRRLEGPRATRAPPDAA